jgi:HD superfamily phosphodiesterase
MENNQTTPKEYTQTLVDKIMFSTSLTHLDEVKEIARIIVEEIKLNSLDVALPFFNNVLKEIEKL